MKKLKILRWLGVVIALSLLLIPVAQASAATLTLADTTVTVGDTVTMYGYGYGSTYTIGVYMSYQAASAGNYIGTTITYYQYLGSYTTDSTGYFTGTFTVPSTLSVGNYEVIAGTYYLYTCIMESSATLIYSVTTFTVEGGGEIEIDPEEGYVGESIEVNGDDFTGGEDIEIYFDGDEIDIDDGHDETRSSGSFTSYIIVPEAEAGDHTIEVIVGSATQEAEFEVLPFIEITPQSGEAGDTVEIDGTGFARRSDIEVYFNGSLVTATSTDTVGSFYASFIVPDDIQSSGVYQVEVEDEDNNSETASFTLNVVTSTTTPTATATATATATTPVDNSEIAVTATGDSIGDYIVINGVSFTASATVTVTFDGSAVATTTTGTDGSFLMEFQVPTTTGGTHTIVVTDGTHSKTLTFDVETTAPSIPQPLEPAMSSTLESPFTFDWEEVTDASEPVTYEIQIATSEDFSTDSIVLDLTGLTGSSYVLTDAEELKLAGQEDAYYWRLRSVDGASNASGWTGTGEFYVSTSFSFPTWLIITLSGVGAVIIFGIGYLVGRRTAFYY